MPPEKLWNEMWAAETLFGTAESKFPVTSEKVEAANVPTLGNPLWLSAPRTKVPPPPVDNRLETVDQEPPGREGIEWERFTTGSAVALLAMEVQLALCGDTGP
jgi:hypothetical protein